MLREALTNLLSAETEAANLSMSVCATKAEFEEFLHQCETKVNTAVEAARRALQSTNPEGQQ